MNVAFRVDAANIGLGHFMRCFALAEELVKRNNNCYFLSDIDDEKIHEKINKSNVKLEKISTSPESNQDLDYLVDFSKKNNIDWIVTDHYDISTNYIKEIKNKGFKVLSIDDTSQIYYHSDIVVNQNIGSEKLKFNADDNTKFLLGPKYVMLRDELLKKNEKKIRNYVKKIIVTLGGIGHDTLTSNIIKLLNETIERNIEIIIVFGPLSKTHNNFKSKIKKEQSSNYRFVFSPRNMADLYLEADIAISAGGSSCYEFAYFGIPNMIITVADNQINVAKELGEKNISIYIGKSDEIKFNNFKENLIKLINNRSFREQRIKNATKLVDGLGKNRIVNFMEGFN